MPFTIKDFIDRFTQTDELMRDLIKAQNTTNQLLYHFLQTGTAPQSIVISDPGGMDIPDFGSDNYKTFIYRSNNIVVNSNLFVNQQTTIFEKSNIGGILKEIKLLSSTSSSDNSDYSIRIISDEDILLKGSYDDFATYSNYESDITAYNDDDYYILIIQEIAFTNSIRIEIYESEATFDLISIKYHQRI